MIQDGWHDGGQGPIQFILSGGSIVTHQGGTIYTGGTDAVTQALGFSGQLSLLGVATDVRVLLDAPSNGQVLVAGSLQTNWPGYCKGARNSSNHRRGIELHNPKERLAL